MDAFRPQATSGTPPVRPGQLHTAARIADALVYTVGLAGIIAGAVLWRQGNIPFSLVAWALTFVAGAGLRLVAWLTRGVAQLLQRTEIVLDELAVMRRDQVVTERGGDEPPDPYSRGRWGWH